MGKLSQLVINRLDEEHFIEEFCRHYNASTSNKIVGVSRTQTPEPDFFASFEKGQTVYIEVTQIYRYSDEAAPHNHLLNEFCRELSERLSKSVGRESGKLLVTIGAAYNQVPSKKKPEWEKCLCICENIILKHCFEHHRYFDAESMPVGLSGFNFLDIHYIPKSIKSISVIANTVETFWEGQRMEMLHFRISDKNKKKYELKQADKVWLLIRDRDGFQTIASNLADKGYGVVSNKFERIFLQEEYNPNTKSYPFTELKVTNPTRKESPQRHSAQKK